MFFDPLYLILIAPAALLAAWASWRVRSSFQWASQLAPASGISGEEAAAVIVKHSGLQGVVIEPTEGFLGDHYDPTQKVLRLSPQVMHGKSLAALGVAAHEAGHALQDAEGYPLLRLRNGLVPLANTGGSLSMILLMVGFLLQSFNLVIIGIVAFSMTVLFQLINLPVEFDASRRAKKLLLDIGIIRQEEAPAVKKVLSAAALTYVAATLMGIMQLLYFLIQAGLFGGNRDEA